MNVIRPNRESDKKLVRVVIPWVKHLDHDSHGYAVANLFPGRVDMNFYRVSDVEDPDASVALAVTKTWTPEGGFDS